MNDVLTRGVAVQDLEQEQRGGCDGIELASSSEVFRLTTCGKDRLRAETAGQVLAQPGQDRHDEGRHGRAPSSS